MKFEPGVHAGVPMAEYLKAPALSASILQKVTEKCPFAGWHESWLNPHHEEEAEEEGDGDDTQRSGSIAHGIFLEGSTESVAVIDPKLYPTRSTGNIPKGWTNVDIRKARDAAIRAGKIPVLASAMVEISKMVEQAWRYVESLKTTEPALYALFQPDGGDSELTLMWDEDGIPCRIRPDRLSRDRRVTVNYKTTKRAAEPAAWGRTQLVTMGYYVDAAFYDRGIRALFGQGAEHVFLVQEQDAPYLCSLVGMDPEMRALGRRKTERGIEIWRDCVASGVWAGYPNRVAYPELPPWEKARWEGGLGYREEAGSEPQQEDRSEESREQRLAREASAAAAHFEQLAREASE